MLGPRVPLPCSGMPKGLGLAFVKMGGEGAHGDGGRNIMGEGEVILGCCILEGGALYGLNRFGCWPDIFSVNGLGPTAFLPQLAGRIPGCFVHFHFQMTRVTLLVGRKTTVHDLCRSNEPPNVVRSPAALGFVG